MSTAANDGPTVYPNGGTLKNQKKPAKPRQSVVRPNPVNSKQTPPGTLKRGSRIPSPINKSYPVVTRNKRQVNSNQKIGGKAAPTKTKTNKLKTSSSAMSVTSSTANKQSKLTLQPKLTSNKQTKPAPSKQLKSTDSKPVLLHTGVSIKTPSKKPMARNASQNDKIGLNKPPQQVLKINSVLDEKALRIARRDAAAKRQSRDKKFVNGTSRTYSVV